MTDWEARFRQTASDGPVALSAAGAARRAGMLPVLMREAVLRGRRRVAWRGAAAATLAAGLLVASLVPPHSPAPPAAVPGVRIEIVRDDPGILARLAPPSPPVPPETWVDDDQLLSLLASAERSTGLIRTSGRVILTAAVTDALP